MTGFRGVFPAIITPMTQDGRLNEAAFREVLEFNIRGGVHGFWVAGGTGEGILLDDDDHNLSPPDWTRLALWDELRLRFLHLPPDAKDRQATRFVHD